MSRPVPAATAALQALRFLSTQASPAPAERIARAIAQPRSSTYHLLAAMAAQGFVLHYPDDHRWGLGVAAYEVGSGYTRQQPLQRLGRGPLSALVDRIGQSAHLVVLHGRDVLYVLEERAPRRPSLVSDVGVRLPASLTASGRAILAALPRQQIRALYGGRSDFVVRHDVGPTSLSALTSILVETRRRGHAEEHGEVTPGLASVAVAIEASGPQPWASVAVTFPQDPPGGRERIVAEVARTAHDIGQRLGPARATAPITAV